MLSRLSTHLSKSTNPLIESISYGCSLAEQHSQATKVSGPFTLHTRTFIHQLWFRKQNFAFEVTLMKKGSILCCPTWSWMQCYIVSTRWKPAAINRTWSIANNSNGSAFRSKLVLYIDKRDAVWGFWSLCTSTNSSRYSIYYFISEIMSYP